MKKLLQYALMGLLTVLMALPVRAQITTEDDTLPAPSKSGSTRFTPSGKNNNKDNTSGWQWDRFYAGGLPGFGISNYYVTFDISGEAGYFVHDKVSLGMLAGYSYVFDKYYDVSYNVIRFGPYARGYVWEGLFAQTEYQVTVIKNYIDNSDPYNPVKIPTLINNALLVGGGYHDNFENGLGFYFVVLFNVINASAALSPNPNFQVGLTYRLNGRSSRPNVPAQ